MMTLLFYISMMMTGTCMVSLFILTFFSRSGRVTLRRAKSIMSGTPQSELNVRRKAATANKLFAFTGWMREHLRMSISPQLSERFEQAGILSPAHHDVYVVGRTIAPFIALIAASLLPFGRAFFLLAFPAVAYLAPNMLLTHLEKSRREKIRLSIPDAIDLLVICVDAGLGLDQAILRVAQELNKRHPALQQELIRINREQRAGKQRLDAWASMAERNELPEIDGFVNMLQQTERFGTPIARALSDFADGLRQKRRQRAEELAAKTTVKIIFPLVLCIFPSLFIVLLGPPGIKVSQGLLNQ